MGATEITFIASCALLPILVFEQHLITGYSLQPFHYNLYTAPYFVLIAISLLFWLKIRNVIKKLGAITGIMLMAILSFWGLLESHYAMSYRWTANIHRDQLLPLNHRLRQLGTSGSAELGSETTFNSNLFQADNQPSSAPQAVLWSEHMPWASDIREYEARRRYFAHLYFMGRDATSLTEALAKCPATAECKAIFGWRVIPTLAIGNHTPDKQEIDEVSLQYQEFLYEISRSGAPKPAISYAVIENGAKGLDLTNIDRWYQRDAGEDFGDYSIFKLTPRNEHKSN